MKRKVSIIGGGASALILGCELNTRSFEVAIYEKNAAPGRKFLVAGEGGLNLTHSENEKAFLARYTPPGFLKPAFTHFSNKHLIEWINALGIETYIGSSGRVFPKKGIKPIEVLNAMLNKIRHNKVKILTRHTWKGFSPDGGSIMEHNGQQFEIKSDMVIFCLGGASWPVTGSTGDWSGHFVKKGIRVDPFQASNCAFAVQWDEGLISKTEGKALKNISVTCGDKTHLGEMVITRFGLEGSGIYPLSPEIRMQLNKYKRAEVFIDFRPGFTADAIRGKLQAKRSSVSLTDWLKAELKLSSAQVALLKHHVPKEDYLDTARLPEHIKHLKLLVSGVGPVDEAISTVGGIALEEIDDTFRLKKMPDHFAIGEMLDFDAPTGGYLLQSCFSMGKFVADHLNAKQ